MSGVIPFKTRDLHPRRAREKPAIVLEDPSWEGDKNDQDFAPDKNEHTISTSPQAPSRVTQMAFHHNGRELNHRLNKLDKQTYNHRADYGQGTIGFPRMTETTPSTLNYELCNPKPASFQIPRAIKVSDPSTHPPPYYPLSDHELASLLLAGFNLGWICNHFPVDIASNACVRKKRKPAGWPYVMKNESGQLVFGILARGYLLCGDYASYNDINKAFEALLENHGTRLLHLDVAELLTPSRVLVPDDRQLPQAPTEVRANSVPSLASSNTSSSKQVATTPATGTSIPGRLKTRNASPSVPKSPFVGYDRTKPTAKGPEPNKLPRKSGMELPKTFWSPQYAAQQRALEVTKQKDCRLDDSKYIDELHAAIYRDRQRQAAFARLINFVDESTQGTPSLQNAPSLQPFLKAIDCIDSEWESEKFEGRERLAQAMEEMKDMDFDAERELEELLEFKYPSRADENDPENPIVGSAETAPLVHKHTEDSNTNG